MAILVRYSPSGMTKEKYDAVGRKIEEAGKWPPAGLLAHVCFGSEGDLRVSEVWESREQQEEFADALLPLLREENIDPESAPEYFDVCGYEFREARS